MTCSTHVATRLFRQNPDGCLAVWRLQQGATVTPLTITAANARRAKMVYQSLLGCQRDQTLLPVPRWCRMLSASESPSCLGRPIGGAKLPMKSRHNNLLELQTVFLALQHFKPLTLSRHGLVRTSAALLKLGHRNRDKKRKRTAFAKWKPYECHVKICSPFNIIFLPIRSLEG